MFKTLPALFFAFSAFVVSAFGQNVFDGPWPLRPQGVPAAEGEVWGELENGLRYVVIPTDAPGNAVSLRLLVGAGRAQEPKGKAGISHLVKDLMFEGTEHFSREEIVALTLSNGMNLRSATRAVVDLNTTVFRVDLEEPEAGAFEDGLGLLGDIAGAPRFEQQSLERAQASLVYLAEFGLGRFEPEGLREEIVLLRSSSYSKFDDATVAAEVSQVKLADLQAYWSEWYRADRMVLVIVGLLDGVDVEETVARAFGDVKKSSQRKALPAADGKFRAAGEIEASDSADVFARLAFFNTEAARDVFTAEGEANYYFSDFLGRYAQQIAMGSTRMGGSALMKYGDAVVMAVNRKGLVIKLLEQLVETDKAMHQLEQFGIRAKDLAEAKSEYLGKRYAYDLDLSTLAWPSLVADRVLKCVVDEIPFRYGKGFAEYLDSVISPLSYDEVKQRCDELFDTKKLTMYVELPDGFGLSSKAIGKRLKGMRKGYDFTWERAGEVKQDFDIGGGFGSTGMVESTELVRFDEYPVLQYEFANNLRVNLIKTDAFPNTVDIYLSIGNGMTDLAHPNPGFEALARNLLLSTKVGQGVEALAMRDLLKLKGLENVDAGVNLNQLFWSAQGRDEEDVSDFLATTMIWMVTSDLDEDDFKSELETLEGAVENSFPGNGSVALDTLLFGSDDRLRGFFNKEDLESLDYSGMREWIFKTRETAYIELTVVGDVQPRTLLRDVRKSFGSAPVRTGKVAQPRHGNAAVWGDAGIERGTYESPSNVGYVSLVYPQVDEKSCESDNQVDVFRALMQVHLDHALSEYPELQDSLEVSVIGEQMVPLSNALKIQVRCSDEFAEKAESLLQEGVASLADSLTPELLDAAKRGSWVELKRIARSSGRLVYLFNQSQGRSGQLRCILDRLENGIPGDLEAFRAVAARQFSAENVRGAVVMPQAK